MHRVPFLTILLRQTTVTGLISDADPGSGSGAVTLNVFLLQVVQQAATLVNHADQTTTGVVIVDVSLEVRLQTFDVSGQQSNLNFRGTSVVFATGVLGDDFSFCSTVRDIV